VAVAENDKKKKERAFRHVFVSCFEGTKRKPGM
jgi:hypothetical protein